MFVVPHPAQKITSRQHPLVRLCRAVAAGRGPEGLVLLDGEHLVAAAIAAGVALDGLITHGGGHHVVEDAAARGVPVYDVTPTVLDAASPVRTPSGMVAIGRWRPAAPAALFRTRTPFLVGLVNVQDPGNVGTAIRSADALGASGVLAIDDTANPGSWKALRAAMGSTFRVPVARCAIAEALALAAAHQVRTAGTAAAGGRALQDVNLSDGWLVLIGHEGAGLPAELLDRLDVRLTIPMRAGVDSLNAGITAALLVWHARGSSPHGRGAPRHEHAALS
jgi:TrmH family RNA methyltransferase